MLEKQEMTEQPEQDCTYEVEYTYAGEAEGQLHERRRTCKKNPKHEGFIPINKFSQQNLPTGFQTEEIVKMIKNIAHLTVRIRCSYTSMIRPTTFPETDQPYSGANLRGCSAVRWGTGFITDVMVSEGQETPDDFNPCPCYTCQRCGHPELYWGKVSIVTAAHVVCASDEVVHTEIDCFYDSDEEKDFVSVLHGDTMRACSKSPITEMNYADDFCQFYIITHDIDLCKNLKQYQIYDLLTIDVGIRSSAKSSLTVIVSHPHGCAKCVSVGDWVVQDMLSRPGDPDRYKYFYNTPTCPGSSGALVWLLETAHGKWQKIYVHSAAMGDLNTSGTVDVFSQFINSSVQCRVS